MGRKITSYLLDTCAVVRYLIRDEEQQYQKVLTWFKDGENGKIKIIVSSVVVAETCFVLESFYKKSRSEIANAMIVFLSQRWMTIPDRDALLSLWNNFNSGFHFVDSFLMSLAEQENCKLLTFDKKLQKRRLKDETL